MQRRPDSLTFARETASVPRSSKADNMAGIKTGSTAPFSAYEWMIAWRYLRARRSEGGVSTMTWISLIGIALAVFALIATLAVRSGFRSEFVGSILGSNAHVSVYYTGQVQANGQIDRTIADYEDLAQRLRAVPGVVQAAPLVKGQVMVAFQGRNAGVEVFGIAGDDLRAIPGITQSERARGDLSRFDEGIALGHGVARDLGVQVGDRVRIISPEGARTALGTAPRVNAYEVVYVFSAGRYDVDRTRVYLPLTEAQSFFNRDGVVDEVELRVQDPEAVDTYLYDILTAAGGRGSVWTWRDSAGGFLRALDIEDNVMFVILSILVLIATLNIVSGLIMLVKNKSRDIGILRTMGLTEGAVLRVFFLCGSLVGIVGTAAGVVMGCLFALYIDPIFSFVNAVAGGGVWDPSIRGIYALPAELRVEDVLKAVALSLGLSFGITYFPARKAARMNPVEALRYE